MVQIITNPTGNSCKVINNPKFKILTSENYNYIFDKKDGTFLRWGKTEQDDPLFSPFGPEILDLEISVNGCPNKCPHCYKGNDNSAPKNMTFATFKKIIDSFPVTLTQVAFGITGVKTNPDFIKMMEYCREIGVIPNFTLTGIDLDEEMAEKVSKLVGALAVSIYKGKIDIGYRTVKMLSQDYGIKQTNVHLMISRETLGHTKRVIKDYIGGNENLKDVNAFVFLGLKPKGNAKGKYSILRYKEFKSLVKLCIDNNVPFGFDSCTAPRFDAAISEIELDEERKAKFFQCSESCESGLMSSYINVDGIFFPCSFCEDEVRGINVLKYKSFMDVWYNGNVVLWRNNMINSSKNGVRSCPVFPNVSSVDF